jgi:hypothetical protein
MSSMTIKSLLPSPRYTGHDAMEIVLHNICNLLTNCTFKAVMSGRVWVKTWAFKYPHKKVCFSKVRWKCLEARKQNDSRYHIANCWTKITVILWRIFRIFHNILKFVCTYSTFHVEPLTVLSRTLVGKHWFKVFVVCYWRNSTCFRFVLCYHVVCRLRPCDVLFPIPYNKCFMKVLVVGNAIPLQALTGSEGFTRRLLDFKTIGTWRWQGCQPYAPAAFTPRKYSWYSFLLESESTPGP